MDRQRLAEAVWRDPADWAARLIYADAMEEAGEDAELERDVAGAIRDWQEDSRLDAFTRAYVETALWCGLEESERSGAELNLIAPASMARMIEDCVHFQGSCFDWISPDLAAAGHDFFLTRNRHGAGFWEGGWGHGGELTKLSHAWGEATLYRGDDDRIYLV